MIDDFRHKGLRKKMVQYLRDVKGVDNELVLNAMLKVPRHLFLDSSFLEFSYQDKAFPIGSDQTISSVYTVAYQTSLLNINPNDKILEIGTGSGYQTAVLSEMGAKVYSIERHRQLHKAAKICLMKLNYRVNLFYGDGYLGWPQESPFDKILLTCGAVELPDVLLNQLKENGLMVIPVGFQEQIMTVITKVSDGKIEKKEHEKCKFVPFLRDKE